jgi:hypothetical protein
MNVREDTVTTVYTKYGQQFTPNRENLGGPERNDHGQDGPPPREARRN